MNKNFPHFQTCYHATNLSSYLDPRQDSPSKSKRAYLPRTDGNIVKKKLLPFRTERKKFTRRERKEKRTLLYNKKNRCFYLIPRERFSTEGEKKKLARMTQAAISTGNQPVVRRRKLPTTRSFHPRCSRIFLSRKKTTTRERLVSFTRLVV